jgi:hypothetical protein
VPPELGAFHQPRSAHTEDEAQRHGDDHQQHSVEQQLADACPEDQVHGGVPAGGGRHDDDVAQRNQRKEGDQDRQDGDNGNAERRAGALAPARRRRAPGCSGSRQLGCHVVRAVLPWSSAR